MICFITFLRAIASCLITNAHYTGIYPTDLIANGGATSREYGLSSLIVVSS